MCFTNPICIFLYFGVIISDCQLTKFTGKRIKLHKIAYKMTKKMSAGVEPVGGRGRGET